MKRISLAAALASVLALLAGCAGPTAVTKNVDLIYTVDFSQAQAVAGFDDSTYSFTEGDDGTGDWLTSFIQLLKDHDVQPWTYRTPDTDGCTGGITTSVHLTYHGAGEDDMTIDGCAAEPDSFEADATAFFSQYREAHHAESGFANADIVALTFAQDQAILGFDNSEYTQQNPQQVARFVQILDENGVVWSEGIPDDLLAVPCPGSITTHITAVYADTDVVVGPVDVGGCSDLAFVNDVTALFSEWRMTGV
jgi:hypothetical protein